MIALQEGKGIAFPGVRSSLRSQLVSDEFSYNQNCLILGLDLENPFL
jgi:hypothetical protein